MKRVLFLVVFTVLFTLVGIGAGELGMGPVVIVHEGEHKLLLLFGRPRALTEPGVALRWPVLEKVTRFDSRFLYFNTEPLPIQTKDEERIVVDNYVVWRIRDPLLFYESFPRGFRQAEEQIDRVVRADVREVIGKRTLDAVVTGERVSIMQEITKETAQSLKDYGIDVQDVRINRTELPEGTERNVFARMRAERERLARKYRAEGEEEGRRIRAEADREAQVIVAVANRESEILRGEGDAEAARIYAEAYTVDPEFYEFQRT